jgi:hypothetical protein
VVLGGFGGVRESWGVNLRPCVGGFGGVRQFSFMGS